MHDPDPPKSFHFVFSGGLDDLRDLVALFRDPDAVIQQRLDRAAAALKGSTDDLTTSVANASTTITQENAHGT